MEDEEDLIDAEIQKQLGEISLADLESDDIVEEEIFTQDVIAEDDTDWVKLYIEKSSERSKVTENILLEAEDALNQCNNIPRCSSQSDNIALIQENDITQQQLTDHSLILYSTTQNQESNLSSKSVEEIEKENEEKVESLEKKLVLEKKNESYQSEKTKEAEDQQFLAWENFENKMQTNVQLMLDKAQYWEKTFEEMAEEQLTQKQDDLLNEFTNSQKKIAAMQQEEELFLQNLLKVKEELESKRKNDAALKIQKWYRGAKVRKLYQPQLAQRVAAQKEMRRLEKIALLEKKKAEMKKKETEEASKLIREKEIPVNVCDQQSGSRNQGKTSLELNESTEASSCHIATTVVEEMCYAETSDGKTEVFFPERERDNSSNMIEEKLSVDSAREKSQYENASVVGSKKETVVPVASLDKTILHDSSLLENEGSASNVSCDGSPRNFSNNKNCDLTVENSVYEREIHNLESPDESKDTFSIEEDDPVISSINTEGSVEISAGNDCLPHPPSNLRLEIKDFSSEIKPKEENVPANDSNTACQEKEFQQHDINELKLESEDTRFETEPCKNAIISQINLENISGPSVDVNLLQNSKNGIPVHITPDMSGTKESSEPSMDNVGEEVRDSIIEKAATPTTLSRSKEVFPALSRDSSCNPRADINQFRIEDRVEGDVHFPDTQPDAIPINRTENVLCGYKADISPNLLGSSPGQISEQEIGRFQALPDEFNVASIVDDIAISSPGVSGEYSQIPDNSSLNTDSSFLLNTINHTEHVSIERKAELELNQNEPYRESTRNLSDKFGDETVNRVTGILKEIEYNRLGMDGETLLPENKYEEEGAHLNTSGKPEINFTKEEDGVTLEDNLSKQHLKWILKCRQNSDTQEKRSATTPPKARRIIRKSSAAKKLLPFSQSELINGAYNMSTCKKENLTTSVEDVQAIFLSPIDGGRNLLSFCNCIHLSHLTIHECGLVSVENLQACPSLQYLDVSHNAINLLSCNGMKRLEALVVSHNQLTSVHGLDGCCSLLYLDFSQNNITKISGLEDAENLLHLRITNNQLLNISGIRRCKKLIYLDVSENHLMSLEDLKECKILTCVIATGNNLEEMSEEIFNSLILLTKLDVSRNSLQTIRFCEETWLPFLVDVNAGVNRIGQDSLSAKIFSSRLHLCAPCLNFIDLSNNLISDAKPLEAAIAKCLCLQKINLAGNPLEREISHNMKFWNSEVILEEEKKNHVISQSVKELFCPLGSNAKQFISEVSNGNKYLSLIKDQMSHLATEIQSHSQNVSKCLLRWSKNQGIEEIADEKSWYPPHLLSLHTAHLKTLRNMLEFSRLSHENEDFLPVAAKHGELTDKVHPHLISDKENGIIKNSALIFNDKKFPEDKSDESQQNLRKALQPAIGKTEALASSTTKKETSRKVTESMKNERMGSLVTSSSVVFEKLKMRNASGIMEKYAATKIQAIWRGYRVRRVHTTIKKSRVNAAIKIQACWRGYMIRNKIQRALQAYNENTKDIGFQEEFEDVDLDGFNFDENFYEMQWAHKVTTSPQRNFDSPLEAAFPQRVNVWSEEKQTHNMVEPQQDQCFTKPPLPPIPKVGYTSISETEDKHVDIVPIDVQSLVESQHSKVSAKQEFLTNQWGIKSSNTADLMMKRARRLKGGRKKMQTAEEKLSRFQERTHQASGSTIASYRKTGPSNKVEYFHGREMEFQARDCAPSAEKEEKQLYTYEWLHSQVDYDKPTMGSRKRQHPHPPVSKRSEGFLPVIPRSPSLVGQQDLEIVSLTSGSSHTNRSRDRLRDIVRRHRPSYTGV